MTPPSPVTIRPARVQDVPAMVRLTDRGTGPTVHALSTDPGGCWVAERDGAVVGCAISRVRELMWILSSFAVQLDLEVRVGDQLLAAALDHGRGCLRGMLTAGAEPDAVRRYRLAGFDLHPQMMLLGEVDRGVLPVVEHVRDGSAGDRDLLDSVDRHARGAAHGPDHDALLEQHRLVVSDRATASGYAYVDDTGSPVLLAATSRKVATTLLWEALASTRPGTEVTIGHVTAANEWAIDVGLAAGLSLHQGGYLCLRAMRPPAPYLHHASLL